mgnify:CR=1 FL=1
MKTGSCECVKTRSYQHTIELASILTQVAVGTEFFVCFEPAVCDIAAALAIAVGISALIRNIPKLPVVVTGSLLAFMLINAVGLIGVASVKAGIRFLGITAYLIIFSLLISSLISEKDGLKQKLVNAYLIAALVTAALIWAGFFGNIFNLSALLRMTYGSRPMSLFKDPNVAGSFLIPAALFLSSCLLEEGRVQSPIHRGIHWGVLFFLISALFHTAGRSAVLCWGVGLLALTFPSGVSLRRKTRHLVGVASFVIVVLPVMYICTGNSTTIGLSSRVLPHVGFVGAAVHQAQFFVADIARSAGIEISFAGGSLALQNDGLRPFAIGLYDYDTGGRLYAWRAALELWKNHPVIGVGPGNLEFLSSIIQERMGASFITPSTHNIYLRVLAENGVLGLVSLMVLLISVLVMTVKAGSKTGKKTPSKTEDNTRSDTAAGTCGDTAGKAGGDTVGTAGSDTVGTAGSDTVGTAGSDTAGKAGSNAVGKACAERHGLCAGRSPLWNCKNTIWLSASLIALIANGLFIDSLHFRHLWLVWALALSEVRTD